MDGHYTSAYTKIVVHTMYYIDRNPPCNCINNVKGRKKILRPSRGNLSKKDLKIYQKRPQDRTLGLSLISLQCTVSLSCPKSGSLAGNDFGKMYFCENRINYWLLLSFNLVGAFQNHLLTLEKRI